MSAPIGESTAACVQDYECLMEGVMYFLALEQEIVQRGNIDSIRNHYEQNPEDRLCHIYRPGTRDMLLCRRSGIEAIQRMSLRLVSEAPNGCDLSSQRVAAIISERIFQVAMDGVTEGEELVRILKSYVGLSETEHVEAAYHFPCVLLHCGPHHPDLGPPSPEEFSVGPVNFQQIEGFLRKFNEDTQAGRKRPQEKAVDMFTESGRKYGWIASVKISRCAPDVSRRRAEEIIEAAINLLKVFIGLRYGRSMRLPHTAPARNRETCVLTDVDDNVEWKWQGRALDGALVVGDLWAAIPACIRGSASNLLTEGLSGERDEATNRLLDALKWFGDASFEESGGVQIVKWIAALERLTATERLDSGITHRFCTRVALLASGLGAGHVEKAYRDAQKAYDLRSDVMHGSRSQNEDDLMTNTGIVHDLTREAILGALAMHRLLGTTTGNARIASMARFYEQSALPHEALFKQLKQEFGKKRKAKKASP